MGQLRILMVKAFVLSVLGFVFIRFIGFIVDLCNNVSV